MTDMNSTMPYCYVCGRLVKFGKIVSITEPSLIPVMSRRPDYFVITWRVIHRSEDCMGRARELTNTWLCAPFPTVYVGWIDLQRQLMGDPKVGNHTLFVQSNWDYVLACVSDDNLPAINEYENPVDVPASELPSSQPTRTVRRRK